LRQGEPALAAQCEGLHQGLVTFLIPRFHLHLPACGSDGAGIVALYQALGRQASEHIQNLPPELLAFTEHPFLEFGAIARKSFQEITAVRSRRPLQCTGGVRPRCRCEHGDVQPALLGQVKLDRISRHKEKGGIGSAVAESLAEILEGGAQVVMRPPVAAIRPEQTGQRFATTRTVGFRGQTCQERPDLLRLEARDRFAGQRRLEGAQQADFQMRHARLPCPGAQ
jgi:hypothetical protein